MSLSSRSQGPLVHPSKYGRYHLPGFNLPVDYRPGAGDYMKAAEGSGVDMFSTALYSDDLEGGWAR